MSEHFAWPAPTRPMDPVEVDAAFTPDEEHRLDQLTAIEAQSRPAVITLGPIEGIGVLRRRLHDGQPAASVLEDVAVYGIIALAGDAPIWAARGLETLTDEALTGLWRKSAELSRAVTIEQVRREVGVPR